MKETSGLQKMLRRLSEVLPREAGPATEQRVLAAFRARRKRSLRAWIYAVAASLLLVFAWSLSRPPSRRDVTSASNYSVAGADFVPLPYAQSDVPLEQAVIVRLKLQASDWAALGVPAAVPSKAGNAISADVLIGQDGVARAVRLVNVQ